MCGCWKGLDPLVSVLFLKLARNSRGQRVRPVREARESRRKQPRRSAKLGRPRLDVRSSSHCSPVLALVQPPPMRTYLPTRDSRRVGQWERGVRAEETRTYLKGNAGGSLRTPGHSTQCNTPHGDNHTGGADRSLLSSVYQPIIPAACPSKVARSSGLMNMSARLSSVLMFPLIFPFTLSFPSATSQAS